MTLVEKKTDFGSGNSVGRLPLNFRSKLQPLLGLHPTILTARFGFASRQSQASLYV